MQTAVVYSQEYLKHNPGRDHPESPRRLKAIMKELKRSHILETGRCSLIEPQRAKLEEVELVHDPEYVQLVKEISAHGGGPLDLGDTVVSPESYKVALYAVGGATKAVDFIMQDKFKNAFVLCRPPGHHAGTYYALGFCIFNNVAVAAKYLLKKYGFERPPLVLAFVLGPLLEKAFRQSMIFSDGSFTIFVTRPISAFFILVAFGVLITAFIKKRSFVEQIEGEK